MLAEAYQSEGRTEDAFGSAAELLQLDSRDRRGATLIAMRAQSLEAPTPEQVSVAEAAANELLRQADDPPRREGPVIPAITPDTAPTPPDDEETQNVGEFLGDLRESHPIRFEAPRSTANGNRLRELADSTLAWVERFSN